MSHSCFRKQPPWKAEKRVHSRPLGEELLDKLRRCQGGQRRDGEEACESAKAQ
jgi:hypothetical protein